MRFPRLKAPPDWDIAYYHCYSRIVDRRRILGPNERSLFVSLMREYEAFCGVRVLTFCVLSNHFHILVAVPRPPPELLSTEELLQRFELLSGRTPLAVHREHIRQLRELQDVEGERAWRTRVAARLCDISEFIKPIKQRFSQTYNRLHARHGTLWEGRFESVLVEGEGRALTTMAAYIDLNPVRAGLVEDPKDYLWSGYGEAVAGLPGALTGLAVVVRALPSSDPALDDGGCLAEYRMHVYRRADPTRETLGPDGRPTRGTVSPEEVARVLQSRGRLPLSEFIRCRVRYFCEGAMLGTRNWVEQVFQLHRHRFGPRRRTGARPVRGLDSFPLYTVRDLRKNVFDSDTS